MTNGELFEKTFKNIHRVGAVLVDDCGNIIATNINWNWWHNVIENQPTIIPAESEEE